MIGKTYFALWTSSAFAVVRARSRTIHCETSRVDSDRAIIQSTSDTGTAENKISGILGAFRCCSSNTISEQHPDTILKEQLVNADVLEQIGEADKLWLKEKSSRKFSVAPRDANFCPNQDRNFWFCRARRIFCPIQAKFDFGV